MHCQLICKYTDKYLCNDLNYAGVLSVYSVNELFVDFKVLAAVLTRRDLHKALIAYWLSFIMETASCKSLFPIYYKRELFMLQLPWQCQSSWVRETKTTLSNWVSYSVGAVIVTEVVFCFSNPLSTSHPCSVKSIV